MAAYDNETLGGELARLLTRQRIEIHVQVNEEEEEQKTSDANHVYSLRFDVQALHLMAMRSGQRSMNGIKCNDMVGLFQVSIEYQMARLIADTVCRSGATAPTLDSDPTMCREFATSLFGHRFLPIIPQPKLSVLPEAILWLISTSLPKHEAIKLAQTHRQSRNDRSVKACLWHQGD